jgi:hypothetical protein
MHPGCPRKIARALFCDASLPTMVREAICAPGCYNASGRLFALRRPSITSFWTTGKLAHSRDSGMTPRAGYEYVRNLTRAKFDHLVRCSTSGRHWRVVNISARGVYLANPRYSLPGPELPPRSTRTGRRLSFTIAVYTMNMPFKSLDCSSSVDSYDTSSSLEGLNK